MRIRSKEEVIGAYSKRYPELDHYFIMNLEREYDKHYEHIHALQTKGEIDAYFHNEIEKNEDSFKNDAYCEGLEDSLNGQYMSILAAFGLIVFFRDNMVDME